MHQANCEKCGSPFAKKYRARFCSPDCYHKSTREHRRYHVGKACRILRDVEAAYIAGFLDGEGTIMLASRGRGSTRFRPTVSFSNTNADVLQRIQNATLLGRVQVTRRSNPNHKPGRLLVISGSEAIASLLRQIFPYLVIKRDQARLVLAYIDSSIVGDLTNRQAESLREAVCILNKRGAA